MKNWKTTLTGALAILTVAVKVINGDALTESDLAAVLAGIGLLTAKDFNVSHSQ